MRNDLKVWRAIAAAAALGALAWWGIGSLIVKALSR